MKKLLCTSLLVLCSALLIQAQQISFQEDFESYQGFGSNLINGWTSGPSGFKVYIRTVNGSNNKICETGLTNSHRKDSLTTPELNLLTGSAVLNFQSRMVDSYTGGTAFFSHIPASGDELKAFLSVDGSGYSQVQDLLPSYPVSSAGLNLTSFSIPISGNAGSIAKVKFVASAKPGTEWHPSFDNFSLVNNNDPSSSRKPGGSETGVILIPNPANQKINIVGQGFGQNALVEIFNILGNPVFSAPLTNGRVVTDVSNFRPGIYIVKISEGNRSAYERLVVKQ
jgi:hypothetical protein